MIILNPSRPRESEPGEKPYHCLSFIVADHGTPDLETVKASLTKSAMKLADHWEVFSSSHTPLHPSLHLKSPRKPSGDIVVLIDSHCPISTSQLCLLLDQLEQGHNGVWGLAPSNQGSNRICILACYRDVLGELSNNFQNDLSWTIRDNRLSFTAMPLVPPAQHQLWPKNALN